MCGWSSFEDTKGRRLVRVGLGYLFCWVGVLFVGVGSSYREVGFK